MILFIVSLIQAGDSFQVIESVIYAIKHFHNLSGEEDPTNTKLMKLTVDAAKRLCSKPTRKKLPLTANNIKDIFKKINENDASSLQKRNFTMMILSFAGFLRYDEVSKLRLSDIKFEENYMKLFIRKSKTDQTNQGNWVIIAETKSDTCPVNILKDYIQCMYISKSEEFLFRVTTFFPSTKKHKLRRENNPISYTTARSAILNLIKDIGLDESSFGLHSLRRGGATAAANMGINDRLFQRHGRWKSISAKDSYVDDDLNNILSVSLGLGL